MHYSSSQLQNNEPQTNPLPQTKKGSVASIMAKFKEGLKSLFFGGAVLVGLFTICFVISFFVAVGLLLYPTLTSLLIVLLCGVAVFRAYTITKRTEAFWKRIAEKRGWEYEKSSAPRKASALLFSTGYSGKMKYILRGVFETFPFQTFQYQYIKGLGQFSEKHVVSVFVYNISRVFPHCYLNYKKDQHVSIPPNTKKLPTSEEFAQIFDLYVAPEYEIEALALFNDSVQKQLISMRWSSDVEFVNDEVYIIQQSPIKIMFESRLKKGAEFASLIQSLPSATNFAPIRDIPFILTELQEKLPFWKIERYGTDRALLYSFLALFIVLLIFHFLFIMLGS